MLKYEINNSNAKFSYQNIDVNGITFSEIGETINIFVNSNGHNLSDNDKIRLVCIDGEHYYEDINVTTVDNDNFFFSTSQYVDMNIAEVRKEYIDYEILNEAFVLSGDTYDIPNVVNKLALVINLATPHYFWVGKENYKISEVLGRYYYSDTNISDVKKCDGDYVLFNGFVYRANVYNGKYVTYDTYKNFSDVCVEFNVKGKTYTLTNGCMPFNEDGTYDNTKIYFFYGEDEIENHNLDIISANASNVFAKYWDPRYFEVVDNGNGLSFAKDYNGNDISMLMKEVGDFHLKIGVSDSFATDMKRDELFLENYLADIEEKSINKIVDFEKRQFVPMYYEHPKSGQTIDVIPFLESNLKPVDKITFNLHFRSRENEYDNDGNVLKEWVTTDDKYWNNYELDSDGNFTLTDKLLPIIKNNKRDQYGDCLAYLNFTDDDVYYQKGKVSKSFIRLSFYDTRDRATQVLQFYSTIFLDSGRLYTKYIKAKNDDVNAYNIVSNEQVRGSTIDDDKRLGVSFSVSNKYDTFASSEGFYLYLFPDIIEGNKLTPLYMKVEFNHAKYGRIIPFIMPTYSKYVTTDKKLYDTPIINYEHFPIHYLNTSGDTISGVNIQRLLNDTYIKVYVKYDSEKNQYVWFLPRTKDNMNNSEMIFNLWEPRINGFETLNTDLSDVNNGGDNGDITGNGELYDIDVHLANALTEDNIMSYSLKINGEIVCNKTIKGGITNENLVTQIRIPDENYMKVKVHFYHCTGNANTYKAYCYNYCGSNVFSDGSQFEGKRNGGCGKEGDVEIDRMVIFGTNGKKILRFYLRAY